MKVRIKTTAVLIAMSASLLVSGSVFAITPYKEKKPGESTEKKRDGGWKDAHDEWTKILGEREKSHAERKRLLEASDKHTKEWSDYQNEREQVSDERNKLFDEVEEFLRVGGTGKKNDNTNIQRLNEEWGKTQEWRNKHRAKRDRLMEESQHLDEAWRSYFDQKDHIADGMKQVFQKMQLLR
jgi:uncharacterized coiled-coil DUF342 family protein